MAKEIINFYNALRHIFGLCPNCGEFFRVSDCKLYQKKKPEKDWMDKIDAEYDRLERQEVKINELLDSQREAARQAGRREANRIVRKVDPIFRPLKLDANDAKVILNPIDFIVFNGMHKSGIKNLVLLDNKKKKSEDRSIQRSIDKAVDKERYEWLTLRVNEDGSIKEE